MGLAARQQYALDWTLEDKLKPELAYLARLVRRLTPDQLLQGDLYDAGLERLTLALTKPFTKWPQYVRCAMHSGVISEFRRSKTRRHMEILEAEPDSISTLTPERLALLKESLRE